MHAHCNVIFVSSKLMSAEQFSQQELPDSLDTLYANMAESFEKLRMQEVARRVEVDSLVLQMEALPKEQKFYWQTLLQESTELALRYKSKDEEYDQIREWLCFIEKHRADPGMAGSVFRHLLSVERTLDIIVGAENRWTFVEGDQSVLFSVAQCPLLFAEKLLYRRLSFFADNSSFQIPTPQFFQKTALNLQNISAEHMKILERLLQMTKDLMQVYKPPIAKDEDAIELIVANLNTAMQKQYNAEILDALQLPVTEDSAVA